MSEWLRQSGQKWKVDLGMAWMLAGVLLLLVAIVGAQRPAWLIAAFAFAAAGFGWTALAVRCRACRKRAVLWAIFYEPGSGWLRRITTTDRCPICEDSGARQA